MGSVEGSYGKNVSPNAGLSGDLGGVLGVS